MARLMSIGQMAEVEIVQSGELTEAVCMKHSTSDGRLAPPGNCDWSGEYDTLNDATEYAASHADRGDTRP